jgi:hypothetical protein
VVPGTIDGGDGAEDLLHHHRRQAQRRLVEHQEARARHQGAADGEHLLLPARHRARGLARALAQDGEELEHAREALLAVRPGPPRVRAQLEILPDRQGREDLPAFRHLHDAVGDDVVAREPVDAPAVEHDLARPGAVQAGDRPQHRRLAGAVGAHHGEDLALFDRHGHAAQRRQIAVGHLHPPELQQGHAALPSSPR